MKTVTLNSTLTLESGTVLKEITVAYHTYGELNENQTNVIWVCHALTANSDVADWWAGVFGECRLLDPTKYFIVCANVLGSCYGTTGPVSSGLYRDFPLITPRDMASVHDELRQILGIQKIHLLIGSSLGGQQALEWSIAQPEVFENAVYIATNAQHSPFGIAFNESQRLAIYADNSYADETPAGGRAGLIAARSIAMLSYRTYEGYRLTQSEESNEKTNDFKAASYQRYQGEKLANRFDAYSYVTLSKAMDAHNVGRDRESVQAALQQIKAKSLVISVSTDVIFPPEEQQFLAKHIPGASYTEIYSDFGHDGFLVEQEQLIEVINKFLKNEFKQRALTCFKI